ncbi:MAG: helix-turn-helix domain-containing protein [Proteobacteria bacterium]|nr:helix-turn-helix domain-containing protein [Pseudomonadota bacterium]
METPGTMLKREREARGLTIRELAEVTRIPEGSLIAIENNAFDGFPAEVFVRGFLRNYARELSLPIDAVIQSYDAFRAQRTRHQAGTGRERSAEIIPLPTLIQTRDSDVRAANTNTTDEEPNTKGFRFAYVIVAVIAVASIALSLMFTGTGEAEEYDGQRPAAETAAEDSPFLISNTSEGWILE